LSDQINSLKISEIFKTWNLPVPESLQFEVAISKRDQGQEKLGRENRLPKHMTASEVFFDF